VAEVLVVVMLELPEKVLTLMLRQEAMLEAAPEETTG
tara:strand:+ start:536 stop:646 length:111 start_codon:yes stop_codon:yes gene_type:complete